MALDRALLESIEIPEEFIDEILNGHTETVNGLREEIEKYKTEAEQYEKSITELEALQAERGTDYKQKHDELKAEFEKYKGFYTRKQAYNDLLEDIGLPQKYINRLMAKEHLYRDLEIDSLGRLKNYGALAHEIRTEWAEMLPNGKKGTEEGKTGSYALKKIRGGK